MNKFLVNRECESVREENNSSRIVEKKFYFCAFLVYFSFIFNLGNQNPYVDWGVVNLERLSFS